MKKKSIVILVMTAIMIFVFMVEPALAATETVATGYASVPTTTVTRFRDGSYSVNTVSATPPKAMTGPEGGMRPATVGGIPSHQGSRNLYVTNKIYSQIGDPMFRLTTGVYWEWHNGAVTRCMRYAPQYVMYSPFTVFNGMGHISGGWQLWNNNYKGQYFVTETGHFSNQIGIIVYARWDCTHQRWLHGNGTWRWRTLVSRSGVGS